MMHTSPDLKHLEARPRKTAGFTLVELVMVILIIGVLATLALPKTLDLTAWRLRAFADELQAQTQGMQRLSLAQRRPIVVTIDTTGVSFAYVAGASLFSINCPASASPCISEAGPRTVTFNSGNSGRAVTSTGTTLPITVSSGGSTQAYQIESDTGLIRLVP